MLNLTQVQEQVKQMTTDPTTMVISHSHVAGMNECYRQLKALGWTSAMEMHPTDRVPLFRLDIATIRRDKSTARTWIVEIGPDTWDMEGGLLDITNHVKELLAETQPQLISVGDTSFLVCDPTPTDDGQSWGGKSKANLSGHHSRQLRQLYRLDPKAAAEAEAIMTDDPDLAVKLITKAMLATLAKKADPTEKIWQTIVERIKSQDVPYFDGQQSESLGKLGKRTITLYRKGSHIRLYDGLGVTSAPVGILGRDDDHISGPKAIWKLIDDATAYSPGDARRAFSNFVNHQESPRRWRKTASGWVIK